MEDPSRHGSGVVKLLDFLGNPGASHEAVLFIVLLVLLLCRCRQISSVVRAVEGCLLGSQSFARVVLCFVTGGKSRLVMLRCLL